MWQLPARSWFQYFSSIIAQATGSRCSGRCWKHWFTGHQHRVDDFITDEAIESWWKTCSTGRHNTNQQPRKAYRPRNSTAERSTRTSNYRREKSPTLSDWDVWFDNNWTNFAVIHFICTCHCVLQFYSTSLPLLDGECCTKWTPFILPLLGVVALTTATCQTIYFQWPIKSLNGLSFVRSTKKML